MQKLKQNQIGELESVIRKAKKKGEVLRAQAILLVNEGGTKERIKSFTGYSRAQAFRLKQRYLAEGIECLTDKREGKPKELLSKKEREEIIEIIKIKTPENLGFASDHWTTGILGSWIEREYKATYKSKTSLYLVFRQAKFTYHKPGRVYHEHNEKVIQAWKRQVKPRLKKLQQEQGTVILSADEMILTTETTIQKVWLPQGEYPKIECSTGGRKRRSVYGFLNVKTGEEYAFKTELQNMYVTKEILEKVRALYPKQKIVLFWDNAGWHKGSVVQAFIKQDKQIDIIYFPTYAPEENPQEHVWKSGRSQCTHNRFIQDIDAATDELIEYFNKTKFRYQLLGQGLIS